MAVLLGAGLCAMAELFRVRILLLRDMWLQAVIEVQGAGDSTVMRAKAVNGRLAGCVANSRKGWQWTPRYFRTRGGDKDV
jgi:hypothetical protein